MIDCLVVADRWLLLTVAVIFLLGATLVLRCPFFAEEWWSWLTCKLVMELLLCDIKSAGCYSGC